MLQIGDEVDGGTADMTDELRSYTHHAMSINSHHEKQEKLGETNGFFSISNETKIYTESTFKINIIYIQFI